MREISDIVLGVVGVFTIFWVFSLVKRLAGGAVTAPDQRDLLMTGEEGSDSQREGEA